MVSARELVDSQVTEGTIGMRSNATLGLHRSSRFARLALAVGICCAAIHLPYPSYGQTTWQPSGNDTYVPAGVKVGIGTATPAADLDIGGFNADGALRSVFARQSEGNATGEGTFLGVRAWGTQPTYGKMFSIENTFYGTLNSSIEFYRGGNATGGFMTFTTNNGSERARIDAAGNVGIGTTAPQRNLHIYGAVGYPEILIESSYSHSAVGRMWGFSLDATNGKLGLRALNGSLTASNGLMTFDPGGNVGIGTLAPQHKLSVNGTIGTKEVVVTNTGWADHVFRPDYQLAGLDEVAAHIQDRGHLPGIPSEAEVKANGVSLGDVQVKLLVKIEELTLHVIREHERNDRLERQNRELQERIARLETRAAAGRQ